jgi:cytochrome c
MSFVAFRPAFLALASLAAVSTQAQLKWEGCTDLAAGQLTKVKLVSRTSAGVVAGTTAVDASLFEPVKLAVAKSGEVFFVERGGNIKVWKPGGTVSVAGKISVFTGNNKTGLLPDPKGSKQASNENGLHGIVLDPNFETNRFFYLHYSPTTPSVMNISRLTMKPDNTVDMASEKVLLQIPIQRNSCCHTGGGMEFDQQGNLYITVGNNTTNPPEKAADAYIKESDPDADDQGHAANTNDLRGKILRIRPKADGTYEIPDGNLFAKGLAKTRGEIYAMGLRNPYSLAVDRYRGWIAWGDIGPDDGLDYSEEWNVLTAPGNAGWPYFVGKNQNWRLAKDASAPQNMSPNNTGLNALPPAVPATIASKQRCAVTGPFYHYNGADSSKKKLPPHLNQKWLVSDWWDGFLDAVTLSADGKTVESRVQLKGFNTFEGPLDLKIGPDGALYVVEYGQTSGGLWFSNTAGTSISRLEYTGTCHPLTPVPVSLPEIAAPSLKMAFVQGINLGLRRDVALPEGVKGFRLFDVQGRQAWEYRTTGRENGRVAVPASVGNGILRVKYLH